MPDEIEQRKEKFLTFLKEKKDWLIYIVLAIIIWFGYSIRIKNLPLMQDKYPLALDPYVVLRYAQYILENGKLMALDTMRYYPIGFNPINEFSFLSHFIVYLYKFLHLFNPSITLTQAHILYPPICFAISLVFFFLLIKKLFNFKIALLASAFLAVIPSYLYRTMAGFSDKESLAMMFMFILIYFFISGYQSKNYKKIIIFGLLSGIFTAFMGSVWGGVAFIFLIIGFFGLILILFNNFKKKDFYLYSSWLISMIILISILPNKFTLQGLIFSLTSGIMIFTFLMAIIDFFLFKKNMLNIKSKIKEKLPLGIANIIISLIIVLIITSILFGPSFLYDKICDILLNMLYPIRDRWSATVAENHQPFVTDWIGQMSLTYLLIFIIGSVVLFYELLKPLKKHRKKLTILYTLFILSFIFSRYSSSAKILNGTSTIAKFLYVGSLIIFFLIIIISYNTSFYKNKEVFSEISKLNKDYIFVFLWFLILIIGARSAIRLIFLFSPTTTILASFLVFKVIEYTQLIKEKTYKLITIIILILIIISPFGLVFGSLKYNGVLTNFALTSSQQAKYTGPSYNQQWQVAGQWIRENTPEDAVFSHWWDYGYWVQTGGGRATITDGGNAMGSWNHLVGRHLMTAQNETEALELLKTHGVTHLLMISDEIGKYPAYSSIGSDENYDRYSWINTFSLDMQNVRETRNETLYLYRGGTVLDEDFIYEGKLYPKQVAGIGGFFLPIQTINKEQDNQTVTELNFGQPKAVLVYNGQQIEVPLSCVFFNKVMYEFEDSGLNGCLIIIPKIDNNQLNPIGASLYISPRVRRSLFAQLYLFSKDSENFKVVYNDETNMPLAIYSGRLIGPLKIWEVSYPKDIQTIPCYLSTDYPNPNVTKI